MNGFEFFVGGILPYLAFPVFLIGMIYKIVSWYRTPQPGKMTLFPAPPSTNSGILKEILFFPSLYRGDKTLWVFAWVFHVALALAFIGHFRVVTAIIDKILLSLGMSTGGIDMMSAVLGGGAGIVLLLAAGVLFFRRLLSERVREISGVPDFFALILLLSIIITGNVMRFGGEHFDLAQTHLWIGSLLAFSPVIPASGAFILHAFLAQLLIVYIPFSKIMHFGGIFFTQALVKRR